MTSIPSPRLKHAPLATGKSVMFSPVGTFALAASFGAGVLALLSVFLLSAPAFALILGLATYLLATVWMGRKLAADFPHATLGWCNIVTLTRLVIVSLLLAACLAALLPSWGLFALAVLALSLDGIDGWLARKHDRVSEFGARFDVEVDAAFALILAFTAVQSGAAGVYVLFVGLPYYAFTTAKLVLPWLDRPLDESFSRKAVCVAQIAALIALQAPILAGGELGLLIVAVSIALLWSFGRDILWLWRKR